MTRAQEAAQTARVAKVLKEFLAREIVPLWEHEGGLPWCSSGSIAGGYAQQGFYLLKTLCAFPGLPPFRGAGGRDFFPYSTELDQRLEDYHERLHDGLWGGLRSLGADQQARIADLAELIAEGQAADEGWLRLTTAYLYHARKRRYRPGGAGHSTRADEFKERMRAAWPDRDNHFSDLQIANAEQWVAAWEDAQPQPAWRRAPVKPRRSKPGEFQPLVEHRSRLSPLAERALAGV